MAWLLLAFMSAALLGCYDSFKKEALKGNAVIPVLFLNTLFSSLIFLPFIVLSGPEGCHCALQLGAGLFRYEAPAADHRRSYQCHTTCHGACGSLAGLW